MTHTVICAPLAIEAAALRRSAAADAVVHTGYGARRSRRAAARLRTWDLAGVAVAGVAAGLDPQVRAGDVVVATEVRSAAGVVACPSAPILAAALRRRGARVVTGPVHSVDGLVRGAGYADLAATGAVAADLESASLAAGAAGRPFAVARVVVDTPGAPLLRPGAARAGAAALARLPAVADALGEWATALGNRQILLAAPRSFCAGVERAISIVEGALRRYGPPVYVRKQIVHNGYVVRSLQRQGAVFVEELDEVPPGATVIFSAHGVAPAVHAEAARRHLSVIDGTCPLVAKVHAEARRLARHGATIAFIGHAGHEETEGTLGEAPERTVLVQSAAEAGSLTVADPERVAYLMQTTLSTEEAGQVADALRRRFPAITAPSTDDICYATTNRQAALRAVARECDVVFVVGSANSSNSLRLVETAQREGTAAYRIDGADGIDPRWLAGASTVGVTAGASAPPALVDGVLDALGSLGRCEVAERRITTETIQFTVPKEATG